ncbi:S9 family peptidase [Idiomarina sp. UBA4520]|jgi:dipeptidyl aminopeptidase/acylaminoacyl peptidase|uniref:S9 family peptidase n=1 Tax=Idiomarina sp. UBA4520 TaxID=1946647 RepID=UPI000A872A3D|nr:S9 family peptidase [Idiomarina sp. UBA4520]MBF39734.1 hypothetical protein [Idiomarinaceae bacterium]|tara:strand:- start:15864 stop:17789 length:1926 start_codon:yes stop_codon:yes gene_type:complete
MIKPMKICIAFVALSLLSPLTFADQSQVPLSAFAANPSFSQMKISPNGDFYAATFPVEDQVRLAVLKSDTFELVHQYYFGEEDKIAQFWWANNDRLLMRTTQKSGQYAQSFLDPRLYAADIGGKVEMIFKEYANLSIASMLREDKEHILIRSNHEKKQFQNIYKLNVYTGRMQTIAQSPFKYSNIILDNDDEPRVALEQDEDTGETRVWLKEDDDWTMIDSFPPFKGKSYKGSIRPISIAEDNKTLYLLSDEETSTLSLYEYDLTTKKKTLVYENPTVDISPVYEKMPGWSAKRLVAVTYDDGKRRREYIDADGKAAIEFQRLSSAFNGEYPSVTSQTKDADIVVIKASSDKNPGTFYEFNRKTNELKFLAKVRPEIDPSKMANVKPIEFEARDGLKIHGYLTIPPGKEAKDLPLVVYVHGGPHGPRDYWTFDPYAQAIASRGYALLQINYRGSGGYGKEFEQMGFGKWGQEMQNDLTDGTKWAIEHGIADADRICIFGGSYGGYASLMGVVKEPDLYQCAVGYVGVYDLLLMKDTGNVAERLDWGLDYLNEALGESEEKLKAISPHYHVDKIKADVFIVHGGRDEQAHYDNALNIREQFKKHNKPLKWMWKETEGHGFAAPENRLDLMEAMIEFFDKNLK